MATLYINGIYHFYNAKRQHYDISLLNILLEKNGQIRTLDIKHFTHYYQCKDFFIDICFFNFMILKTFLWTFICTVSVFRKRDDLSINFDLRHYFSCNWCMDLFDGFTRKQTVPCFLYLRKLEETAHVFRIFRWIFKNESKLRLVYFIHLGELYISTINCRFCIYSGRCFHYLFVCIVAKTIMCERRKGQKTLVYDCSHFCGMKTFVKMSFKCFIIEFDTCFEFHN